MIEKLANIAILTLLIIVGIPLLILLLPLILIFLIYNYFKNKHFKKEYNNYLQSLEGKKFFCYNNRKNNHHYVEKNIIPKLNKDIEYVFLDNRVLNSDYVQKYMSHMLYNVSDKKGFPYLIKICNGKTLDISINSHFYNYKNQDRDPENLILLINNKFEKINKKSL